MGDALKNRFTSKIDLIASSGGVFEVEVDGKEIFSKRKTGRFPEESELAERIENSCYSAPQPGTGLYYKSNRS